MSDGSAIEWTDANGTRGGAARRYPPAASIATPKFSQRDSAEFQGTLSSKVLI